MKTRFALIALPLTLAACGAPADNTQTAATNAADPADAPVTNGAAPAAAATATLTAADGAARGSATLAEAGGGLTIQVSAEGLPAGEHGWHIHTVGRCDPPKFESAGAHWNPGGKQHGRDNPQGAHSGDMPNLTAGADGRATANFTVPNETLAALLDTDGAALLIHAKPDDYKTDPSGNSGDRIACGVINAASLP